MPIGIIIFLLFLTMLTGKDLNSPDINKRYQASRVFEACLFLTPIIVIVLSLIVYLS